MSELLEVSIEAVNKQKWPDRMKNDDIYQKYNFLKTIIFKAIEHLLKSILKLLNLPVDECKIQGKYRVV